MRPIQWPPAAGPRWGAVKGIGAWRDAVLVAAAVLYVIGYLFWSWNAWNHNLGRLPAIEAQYFVAGILPTLFLAVLAAALAGAVKLRRRLGDWVARSTVRKGVVAVVSLGSASLMFLAFSQSNFGGLAVTGIGAALFFLSAIMFDPPPERQGHARRDALVKDTIVSILVAGLGAIALIHYAYAVYPAIPQEFGGVAPRCAELGLDVERLPEGLRDALLPANATDPAQSARLLVYHADSDALLVKAEDPGGRLRTPTHEVPRAAILAIHWC